MRFNKINHTSNLTKKHHLNAILIILIILTVTVFSFTNTKRTIELIVNGEKMQYQTTALTSENAYEQVKEELNIKDAKVSYDENLVLGGTTVNIKTLKKVIVKTKDKENDLNTYAVDLNEFKEDKEFKKLNLDENYILTTELKDNKLKDETELYFAKQDVKTETKSVESAQTIVESQDENLYEGEEEVITEGQPEIATTTYTVTYLDGKEVSREVVSKEITQEAVDKQVSVGTKKRPVISPENGEVWDQLAQCEAGGNWAINTGNGYYGGLQINAGSWQSIAPTLGITASLPSEATREEQIAVGQVMQSNGGWGQWPACSSQLGL